MKLWDDNETLSPMLEMLYKNDKVLWDSFEEWEFGDIEDYNKEALNSDCKISYREAGNQIVELCSK